MLRTVPILLAILFSLAGGNAVVGADLSFHAADPPGYYAFDTGVLRGRLRLDGHSQGIEQLIHVPSGREVTYGNKHVGLMSPYRVFSTGTRYGHAARDWPGKVELRDDGAVAVRFPPGEDHPLEMTALFRLAAADAIDVATTATPRQAMPGFEVFWSNYLAPGFEASVYVKPNRFTPRAAPGFLRADHNPLVDGNYLIFPRDRESVLLIFDGRWEAPPNPVTWCVNRYLAAPLAIRRQAETGLAMLLMARPEDCFAVATPYNQDPPDGVASHRSLYLSLFGRDVAAGETVSAHMRLVVSKDLSDDAAVARYEDFLAQTGAKKRESR